MRECKYCGTFYEDSLNHCPNCGGNRVVSEEEKRLKEILVEKENTNQQKFFSNNTAETSNNKKTPIIVVSVIVVLALIVGIYFYKSTGFSNVSKQEIESYVERGTAYYNNGNYELALKEFSSIPEATSSYKKVKELINDSKEKYKEEMFQKVDTLEKEENFKDAYSTIQSAMTLLEGDSELEVRKTDIYSKYRSNEIESTLSKVSELESESNYFEAIKTIQETRNVINDSNELDQKQNELENVLLDNLDNNILTVYKENGYDSIINYLQELDSIIPGNDKVLQEQEVWKNRKSVFLNEIDYFQKNLMQYADYTDELTSNFGDIYTNSLIRLNGKGNTPGSIEYHTNGEYGKLTFTIFVTDIAREYYPEMGIDRALNSAEIKILSDGKCLFTKKGPFSIKSEPEVFEVDITGTKYLEIEMSNTTFGGAFRQASVIGLGNIQIGW